MHAYLDILRPSIHRTPELVRRLHNGWLYTFG